MNPSPPLPIIKKMKKQKKQPTRGKMVTGYIIYASEIRKEVIKKHPDKDFGEISKLVGAEWKNLAQESKVNFEKRALEQNSVYKSQFLASAAAAAAVTTTTTTTTTTVNVAVAANGSHQSMGEAVCGDDSLEKTANDSERQLINQQQQQQQQQQHHYSQQQAAYYSQLLDQAAPILIRPTYQGGAPNGMPPSNDALLDQQSQSQHSQQSQSPAQSSPPQQQQQQQPPPYQLFSHPQSQQMTPGQQQSQQSSPQLPYQLFQYPQQPTMVPYCNDPACCASGRYQPYPYPFSPPGPPTTPSQQQEQQQPQTPQHQQQQVQSPENSPSPHDQFNPYKRNNIIYRKPSSVRLRPKDAATQTDPIAWIENIEKMSPKKELRFSEKFIEHISSLGSNSPNRITDADECH